MKNAVKIHWQLHGIMSIHKCQPSLNDIGKYTLKIIEEKYMYKGSILRLVFKH